MRRIIPCLLIILSLSAVPAARPDYYIPPPQSEQPLVTSDWSLETRPDGSNKPNRHDFTIVVKKGGTEIRLPLDLMRLADQIDSDAICTGGYNAKMTDYMRRLEKSRTPVLVQCIGFAPNSPLAAAGVWSVNDPTVLARIRERNPKLFGKAPAGPPEAVLKALEKASERTWLKLVSSATPQPARTP